MSQNYWGIYVRLKDKFDRNKCLKAAKHNGFKNTSDWLRAIISGHFNMMGWKPLKVVAKSKTECPAGHPYDKKNTKWKISNGKKYKQCRTCLRTRVRKYYAEKADKLIAAGKRRRHPRLSDKRAGYRTSSDWAINNVKSNGTNMDRI